MNLIAGPLNRNDPQHTVPWTKQEFKGDIKMEYEYTRTDSLILNAIILYFQLQGIGNEGRGADIGKRYLFYLFNLEDGGSNPVVLIKADNKEFIFQTVYDFTLRKINQNLTHSKPVSPTRKMMDYYFCIFKFRSTTKYHN